MRRTLVYLSSLVVFVLVLVFSTPSTSRTALAQSGDKCNDCLIKIGRKFDQCQKAHGVDDASCYEDQNKDVIHCYATVCEQ